MSRKVFVLSLACLLAVTAVLFMTIRPKPSPAGAVEPEPPKSIQLSGIIRDFHASHPDFNVTPAGGSGHYAGAVVPWLGGTNRPVLGHPGFKVETQWRDQAGRPIAPHLFNVVGGAESGESLGIRVNGKVKLEDETQVDAFNSTRGTYGHLGNFGRGAVISTNSTASKAVELKPRSTVFGSIMIGPGGSPNQVVIKQGGLTGSIGVLDEPYEIPVIAPPPPEEVGSLLGNVVYDNETVTLTGDLDSNDDSVPPAMLFAKLEMKNNATLHVEGDLVMICTELKIGKDAEVILGADANLTLFVIGNHDLKIEKALVNVGSIEPTPSAVTINYLGRKTVKIKEAHVYATILSPLAESKLELDKGHLYGAFIGEELKLKKHSGLHVDSAIADLSLVNPALTVREKLESKDDCLIDGFDSNLGPYDEESNGGTEALLRSNTAKKGKVKCKDDSEWIASVLVGVGADPEAVIEVDGNSSISGLRGNLAHPMPIPAVAPPVIGFGKGKGKGKNELKLSGGTHVLTGTYHVKKLKIENKAIVDVVGDVVVACEDKFEMKDKSEVRLQPGATLTLYTRKEMKIEEDCLINMNTGNPQLVSLRRSSFGKKGKIEIKKKSKVVAWITAPKTELKLEDQSELFGSFIGDKVKIEKKSKFHVDMAYFNFCGQVNDTAGAAGDVGNGGILSDGTFDQWFRDLPGTNQSAIHAITLEYVGNGIYEMLSDQFSPIDGDLLGNEGGPSNSHFTYTIVADFEYDDCGGQFVQFAGGDGAWLYIDDALVMDLGGVRPQTEQYVELDRLGLDPDRPHKFRLFYAQRNDTSRTFHLRTNVELSTEKTVPNITSQFD